MPPLRRSAEGVGRPRSAVAALRRQCGTVFVGSGFVAKYPEGGGNFSVVLQYLLGLRRLGIPGVWLEILPGTGDATRDARLARVFRSRLKTFGLEDSYCLLTVDARGEPTSRQYGLSTPALQKLLAGPNTLLNLSCSVRPPLVESFERRILCSLDPTEICFWMQRMEMGQSHHHEFATIGLNHGQPGCRIPATPLRWKTYFPLVDTSLLAARPRPTRDRFSTVGQWYWDGAVEWDGQWRDFSKRAAFEKFLPLPAHVPEARWTLAMNLNADDPERERLRAAGWQFIHPHRVARTPAAYYGFIADSTAEFTAVKLESFARSGWLSDRSAIYLATGRPVITESTSAEAYLPPDPGLLFVSNLAEAKEAAARVLKDWPRLSRRARSTAVECFDAAANLRRLLAG